MMEAVYRVEGDRVFPSRHAAGPWNPAMQHGSPPAAFVAWAAEAIATREPMQVVRITVDLMRPVPLAPLTYATEILREGRKIQLCRVRLFAESVAVVDATVLKVKVQAAELPGSVAHPTLDVPLPDQGRAVQMPLGGNPFAQGLSFREVRGGLQARGPAAVWYRLDRPMLEGMPTSQLMRAVVAADFSNATSAALDFRSWIFINADLAINLYRPPVGEWILLNSEMWIGDGGVGLARSRLADVTGYFGQAVQSLVIERR